MPSTNDTTASTSPVTATVPCPHACHQLWPTMALHHTSPLPAQGAPAATPARMPGRVGADRRLRARLVRGAWTGVLAAGLRRRRHGALDGAALRRGRVRVSTTSRRP